MNATLGWALAVAAIAVGYLQYGWRGALLAVSVVVFWLLLQFSRALRAMRTAGGAPVGHVASAVMLQSRLKAGQRLMDLIQLTGSLGEKLGEAPQERYRWTDAGGASVTVTLAGGRLTDWQFARPAEAGEPGAPAADPPPPAA